MRKLAPSSFMKQASKTLLLRKDKLADAKNQRRFLENGIFGAEIFPKFQSTLDQNSVSIRPSTLDVLQVNVGYKCNQSCTHCHVDAGPDRIEVMTKETMEECINLLIREDIHTLDITGGAPELNPNFQLLVSEARPYVNEVIVRSNLTIIESHEKFNDLPSFFKQHGVHVISSLPCYTEKNTDNQRGEGAFESSIAALKRLNSVGYGNKLELQLDLVYNPGGAFLPPPQAALELDYKSQLKADFDIEFDQLLCLNNLPVSRFLDSLIRDGQYERYMELLVTSFNVETIDSLMCRNTLSVGWDGQLYDCDFNQMLQMPIDGQRVSHISSFNLDDWKARHICLSQHCYGCTAGSGSSCQGSIA